MKTLSTFTVIMPTRDRPVLFERALKSVLAQTCKELAIIVVNDGSSEEHLPAYRALENTYAEHLITWVHQPRRPKGHGPSYTINSGALASDSDYICFLDDDDEWTDPEHLGRVQSLIAMQAGDIDVVYAHQKAFDARGTQIDKPIWLEERLEAVSDNANWANDAVQVSHEFLLKSRGFGHLNCTVIRRALYLEIGGMDEGIRYEGDRDLYLRTIDRAESIFLMKNFIARHHVPDKQKNTNESTRFSALQKSLSSALVFQKSLIHGESTAIKRHARDALADIYKYVCIIFKKNRDFDRASLYARQVAALHFSPKWLAYAIYLKARDTIS